MTDRDEVISDEDIRGRPAKGADMFNRKFWFLIVVMVAAIAVGGIFLS